MDSRLNEGVTQIVKAAWLSLKIGRVVDGRSVPMIVSKPWANPQRFSEFVALSLAEGTNGTRCGPDSLHDSRTA